MLIIIFIKAAAVTSGRSYVACMLLGTEFVRSLLVVSFLT